MRILYKSKKESAMANNSDSRQWTALIVCLIVTFSAAAIGGMFPPDEWFRGLTKPSFNPPDWVFGLGDAAEVKKIRVRWADGRERVLQGPAADRWHRVAPP